MLTLTRLKGILVLFLISTLVYAQDDEMEGLSLASLFDLKVTTASKRAESIEDAPGVITVITKYEIQQMKAKNLIEVLNNAPSIQMYNSTVFGVNKASIRGDAFNYLDNHTLILIDGRPCREGVRNGFDYPVYAMFPVDAIERIEIVRGPGSVLYGSTAMSGVINIITSKENTKNSLNVGVANVGHLFQSSVIGVTKEDRGFYIANNFRNEREVEYEAKSKPFPGPNPNPALVPWKDTLSKLETGLFAKAYYKDISLTSYWGRSVHSHMGWLVHKESASEINQENRLFFNVDHVAKFGKDDAWELTTSATWNYTDIQMYSQWRLDPPGQPAKFFPNKVDTIGLENSSDFILETYLSGTVIKDLNVLAGGLFLNENKWRLPEDLSKTRVRNRYHTMMYSAYGQVDYTLLEKVKILLGAQANKRDGEELDIVPRFGVIAPDFFKGIGAKVLFGQAFRSPIPPERESISPKQEGGELKPEKISTIDAQVLYKRKGVNVSATYFQSWLKNFISLDQSEENPGFFNNTEKYTVSGFELDGKFNPLEGLMLYGSFMYQKTNKELEVPSAFDAKGKPIAMKDTTHEDVSLAPNWMSKLGVSYTAPFKLSASVYLELYGEQSLYGTENYLFPPEAKEATDAMTKIINDENKVSTMLNLNLGYTFPIEKELKLDVTVRNVLDDKAYQPFLLGGTIPVGYPLIRREMGRSITATLSKAF